MNNDLLILALRRINEVVTAATVIVATSMLMYNLTHSLRDRVVRASSVLLGCVSITYLGDVFVSISKTPSSMEAWLRFQWIGIAFAPAALFHLSDALLETTGLVSRGRRTRVLRLLYMFGVVFLLTTVFTDKVVQGLISLPMPRLESGQLFWLFALYFVIVTIFAVNNVLRARRRCLTSATHRRMTYLLLAFLTPPAGIFPYTLLFTNSAQQDSTLLWILVNLGNLGIVFMLAFMAYPLSFFGSNKPDRVVKADLLRFFLRGPVSAVLVLMVILFVPYARILNLPGDALMPFAAIATLLGSQWLFSVATPYLERVLIYPRDRDQAQWIEEINEHLLTESDAHQLLETTLAAVCDYLRAPSAFVASIGSGSVHLEQVVGPLLPSQAWLGSPEFLAITAPDGPQPDGLQVYGDMLVWQSFWLVPLHSTRSRNGDSNHKPYIGVIGVWARSSQPDLLPEEEAAFKVLYTRAAQVLDGMRLQEELLTTFEDVLSDTNGITYGPDPVHALIRSATQPAPASGPTSEFVDLIRDALRDFWGGPRLTDPELLELKVVKKQLPENDNNPARAVRAVLTEAVESLKPEGQRSFTATEWVLYNILEQRFIQGRKVREVAMRLAMSDADLYRKQRIAVEQVAHKVWEMEQGID